jgi:hypothetical protein
MGSNGGRNARRGQVRVPLADICEICVVFDCIVPGQAMRLVDDMRSRAYMEDRLNVERAYLRSWWIVEYIVPAGERGLGRWRWMVVPMACWERRCGSRVAGIGGWILRGWAVKCWQVVGSVRRGRY